MEGHFHFFIILPKLTGRTIADGDERWWGEFMLFEVVSDAAQWWNEVIWLCKTWIAGITICRIWKRIMDTACKTSHLRTCEMGYPELMRFTVVFFWEMSLHSSTSTQLASSQLVDPVTSPDLTFPWVFKKKCYLY